MRPPERPTTSQLATSILRRAGALLALVLLSAGTGRAAPAPAPTPALVQAPAPAPAGGPGALGPGPDLVVPAPSPHGDSAPTLALARLRYGGGDWYASPTALPNLARAIREDLGIEVRLEEVVVDPLDPELRDHPFLHMTGHGAVDFTPEEAAALRAHLTAGGFLHADDNYGMDAAFREAMALVFPDRELVPIPPDHPVFHLVHRLPEGLPKIHRHDGDPPSAWGIFVDGRLVVFYSHESDLGNGWEDADIHDVPAPLRQDALRMGVNLFAWALAARSP